MDVSSFTSQVTWRKDVHLWDIILSSWPFPSAAPQSIWRIITMRSSTHFPGEQSKGLQPLMTQICKSKNSDIGREKMTGNRVGMFSSDSQ